MIDVGKGDVRYKPSGACGVVVAAVKEGRGFRLNVKVDDSYSILISRGNFLKRFSLKDKPIDALKEVVQS